MSLMLYHTTNVYSSSMAISIQSEHKYASKTIILLLAAPLFMCNSQMNSILWVNVICSATHVADVEKWRSKRVINWSMQNYKIAIFIYWPAKQLNDWDNNKKYRTRPRRRREKSYNIGGSTWLSLSLVSITYKREQNKRKGAPHHSPRIAYYFPKRLVTYCVEYCSKK